MGHKMRQDQLHYYQAVHFLILIFKTNYWKQIRLNFCFCLILHLKPS